MITPTDLGKILSNILVNKKENPPLEILRVDCF